MPSPLGKDEFGRLVEEALATLPPMVVEKLEEVPVEILDRPTPQQMRSVGLGPHDLLLGLYVGTSLADRSVDQPWRLPSVIYLFESSLRAVCRTPQQLKEQVRKTVLHEIGHHFGLNEAQLNALGYG